MTLGFRPIVFILGIFCFSAPGFSTTPKCEVDDTILFANLDWDSAAVHQNIARYLVEKAYGCKTQPVFGTSLPLLTALGRGDVHVMMEVWKDNVTEAWGKLEAGGKVSLAGVNFPDAEQGFFVPTYMIKGDKERGIKAVAPDLKHVKQLNEYWELFKDIEKQTKGRFYNCILGWSCENINTRKLYAYGLDKNFTNFRPGTGAALAAAFAGSYKKGVPFVGYYWGPTWVLGTYDLTLLEEPPYDKEIWENILKVEKPTQVTAYPAVKVYVGVNNEFRDRAPLIVDFLEKYNTSNKLISGILSYMKEGDGHTAEEAAMNFLKTRSDIWSQWLNQDQTNLVRKSLGLSEQVKKNPLIIRIDKPINKAVSYLVDEFQDFFEAIASPIRTVIIKIENLLTSIPWWALVGLFSIIGYLSSRSWSQTMLIFVCMFSLFILGIWNLAIQTLALMLLATTISVIVGIPIGVFISLNDRVRTFFLPILDAMQTMPSFVYLIPALMLFGLGKVPAIFATVIYAISPLIKLTDLGIRQVRIETIEAANSFGASRRQLLTGVQLPLAMPSIMAGINQTTMLALSMVVVASMIGSRGLGEEVLLGIQKLDVGRGFTGGIGIVALAIAMDRITQGFGKRLDKTK